MFSFYGNFYKVFELHSCPIDLLLFLVHFSLLYGQLLSPRNHTPHRTDDSQSTRLEPVSTISSIPVEPHPIQRRANPCVALFGSAPQYSHTTQPPCQTVADYGSGGIGRGGSSARGGLQTGEGVLNTRPGRGEGASIQPPGHLLQRFQHAGTPGEAPNHQQRLLPRHSRIRHETGSQPFGEPLQGPHLLS
nr:MAG TPA: hypothetical protein [Caudoviricetes sp.]